MEKSAVKFLWHYIKIFKWFFCLMLLLLIISTLSGQIYPLYLAKIYDTAAGKVNSPSYWIDIFNFTIIAAALGLVKAISFNLTFFLAGRFFPETRSLVSKDIFDHVNSLSIRYFNEEMSGRIATKVSQLQKSTIDFFNQIMHAVSSLIFLFAAICFLSYINFYFFISLVIWLFFISFIAVILGKKRHALAKNVGKKESLTGGVIVDSLSNYSEVKSYANFHFEKLNLLKYLRDLRKAESKEWKIKSWIHLAQSLIMVCSMIAFMFLSIWVFKNKQIDTTQFIYANTLFAMVSSMIFDLSWLYNGLSSIFGNINSALETLAVEPEIKDSPKATPLIAKNASISFENVSFAYKGTPPLFQNLSVTIRKGEKVGLVGTSGAGKSTFVKLISRYYDLNQGAITINGIDIRNITQNSLRKHIAVIPQDISLFNRSLKDNIRYGKTNATDDEIFAAAKKASASFFIEKMPQGYETIVGERGVILSGGERQRIAIARAILKNAPILIFDEATSALDSESEQYIQKSLSKLMKNKTVIAVAHRLSPLREIDRILVFDKGKIIEEGSHLALLRKKGAYYKLYKIQSNGFMNI